MKIYCALVFLALIGAANAQTAAQVQVGQSPYRLFSGNGFLEHCDKTGQSVDARLARIACANYLVAVEDTARYYMTLNVGAVPRWCPRPNLEIGQILDVLLDYLRKHPQSRDHPTIALHAQAMQDAYGCRTKAAVGSVHHQRSHPAGL